MPKYRGGLGRVPADEREPAVRLQELESSLEERDHELRKAHRIARLGTWRWIVETDTAIWSEQVYQTFELDPRQPAPGYREIEAWYTPESIAVRNAAVQKALLDGEFYEHERELVLPDGKRRWILVCGEAGARNADGRVTELCGTIQDITDRKQTELALREREEELSEAHRISKLGTWRYDAVRLEAQWSPEIYTIFGLTPAIGPPRREWLEPLFVGDGWQRVMGTLERSIKTGERYEYDTEIVAADGVRRWFTTQGGPVRWGENGEVLELRGTTQDITDRKRTETALRERERELLEAQRIARLGTFRWNKADNVVTWSEEVFRAFGVDPSGPVPRGDALAQLLTPESWERISKATYEALEVGTPYSMDLELVDRNGAGRRWVTVRGEGLRGPDGQVTELAGTVQDVTEPRRIEEALREREYDLREAQRIAELGSWRWVAATDKLTWSEQMYRLFERDPAEPPPREPANSALFAPGHWDRALQAFHTMATSEQDRFSLECQLIVPSGALRWAMLRAEAVRSADGTLMEVRGTMRDMTERKLQVDALARSEERYRSLVGVSSDLVWIASPEGKQMGEIPEWQAFTGQSAEQVRGFGWSEAIHPEDRAYCMQVWQNSLRTGETMRLQHRLRRQDGVYRTMQVRAVASRDAEGRIVEWVGMHTDITEQVEAEAALAESQSRFAKLYEANLIGICYPDRFGAFSDGNDEFLRIVGYTRDDLAAGKVRWDTMTPPKYAELDRQRIAEAAERGSCTPYEKEYVRKDGSLVPILCGYALRKGSTDEYIGFIMDLSAQKQVEQALRERERRFRELAESLPELVWVSEANGMVSYINHSFEAYAGKHSAEIEGGEAFYLVHPDDRERSEMLWRHSIAEGCPYAMEVRLHRHDGIYRTFLARAIPVKNEQGSIERWVGTATDIHDQKLAEEVVRRTEKLAAAGRLAASMAHEINNPLAAVTNSLYLALTDQGLSEKTREYLRQAEQELARVAAVTTQTLRFHHQSSAPAEVDLGEIMDSAHALFQARFRARGITVRREYVCKERLFCRGDELRQVFANLLSNALDATPDGGRIRIRIREAKDGAGIRGVRVSVGDSGHGIPKELKRQVFEPFVSTKEATGTGLGLWVTHGIMQRHKGRIRLWSRVENGPGWASGTVFCLFFPLNGMR